MTYIALVFWCSVTAAGALSCSAKPSEYLLSRPMCQAWVRSEVAIAERARPQAYVSGLCQPIQIEGI